MSIILCPCCREKISSRQKVCPHCQFDVGGEGGGLSLDEASARVVRGRKYHLAGLSYFAIVAAVVGAIWFYIDTSGFTKPGGPASVLLLVGGSVAYIGLRIMMILQKFKS